MDPRLDVQDDLRQVQQRDLDHVSTRQGQVPDLVRRSGWAAMSVSHVVRSERKVYGVNNNLMALFFPFLLFLCRYGDGSRVEGILGQDRVNLAGLVIENQTFGLAW